MGQQDTAGLRKGQRPTARRLRTEAVTRSTGTTRSDATLIFWRRPCVAPAQAPSCAADFFDVCVATLDPFPGLAPSSPLPTVPREHLHGSVCVPPKFRTDFRTDVASACSTLASANTRLASRVSVCNEYHARPSVPRLQTSGMTEGGNDGKSSGGHAPLRHSRHL